MSDDKVQVDAIVVGGGPGGLAAAFTMAQQGLEVIVIERGEKAGTKSVGGLVYGTVLNTIIPDAFKVAPIERPVSKRGIFYLGPERHAGLEFGSQDWSKPPYNHTYVVNRSQFDHWFAKQAEGAGVNIVEGMVVDDLIYEDAPAGKKVTGVNIRGDEKFYANVVILAEGANAIVTGKARKALAMKDGKRHQEFAVGVKEIIALPREKIEDRFNLEPEEGAAFDFLGEPFKGMIGGGFIYTAKEVLHLGAVARIDTLVQAKTNPSVMLDAFKRHPRIAKLLKGGELVEYSAHMLPEGGFDAIGELTANGLMIIGDSAGLLNASLYKEGTNHAMESGKYAAETAIAAKTSGDFSKAGLAAYEQKLAAGIAMKDMKKYNDLPEIMEKTPGIFGPYPEKFIRLLCDYFTVSAEPKADIQKRAVKAFLKDLPKVQFIRDMIRARKLL